MKQAVTAKVVGHWKAAGVEALVWDGAPSHRVLKKSGCEVTLIEQPAYSPELNLVERTLTPA